MDLTEDEVLEILDLIEKSSFDFFQVETGDLKLTVSKDGYFPDALEAAAGAPAAVAAPTAVAAAPQPAAQPAPEAAPEPEPAPAAAARREGLVAVPAPMVGTFYAAPDPESPPFVEAGASIGADATLGLIEVMKVYTSIRSGVAGTVAEILVANAEFVEFGQDLFLIEPDGTAEEGG